MGHPVYFREGIMFIGTPCIFQGGDHVYWDTRYIWGRGSCLLRHPVYNDIRTPCIFQGGDHVYWDTLCIIILGHPVYFREGFMYVSFIYVGLQIVNCTIRLLLVFRVRFKQKDLFSRKPFDLIIKSYILLNDYSGKM